MSPVAQPPASIGGSFHIAADPPKFRMIVAVDGLEKAGKSNFALTAPGPIAYQNLDIGTEGVMEKFQTEKVIHRADYQAQVNKSDDQATVIKKVSPVIEQFLTDYVDIMLPAMHTGKVRSGVIDTGSDLWKMFRQARFGKLTQVMPHHYVSVNSEFSSMVKAVYNTPGNLIILHQLKSEWKDNPATGKGNKTGQYERDGFAGMGFLVQVNATCWRDQQTGIFHLTVRDCRQNAACAGLDLEGEMATFPWLGVNVFPDSNLSDWE